MFTFPGALPSAPAAHPSAKFRKIAMSLDSRLSDLDRVPPKHDARWTLGFGAGYQLIDSPKVDWDVSGGPAYQENRFSDVVLGESDSESTPALVVGTSADWDITKNVEFDALYRFQLVNELSGKYNHHMVVSFETDITRLIDFDVSWIWDRIQDPRPDSDGVIPEQDDFRTTVGLTFDF